MRARWRRSRAIAGVARNSCPTARNSYEIRRARGRRHATLARSAGHAACCTSRMPGTKRSGNEGSGRRTALLLVDFMNPMDFDGAQSMAPYAVNAARRAAQLRERMRGDGVPVIYANDNFGRWESDFDAVVAECERRGGASATMAKLLAPQPGDRSILKPRHSAFFGTPL